jgi:hydroxyisourate hydrolase
LKGESKGFEGMGRLTTHVLNTAAGIPARGLQIRFYAVNGKEKSLLKTVKTNADGRCDEPILQGADFTAGTYELVFEVQDYFAAQPSAAKVTAPFLDEVPVRFNIGDATQHYHVPLLVTPWSYSTYRGS